MADVEKDLSVAKFEEKHLETLEQVAGIIKAKKNLEEQEKELKKSLMEAMDRNAIYKLESDKLLITLVDESESTRIDLKELKEQDPDLYEIIEQEYSKVTKRAKQLRIKVRE